MESQKRVHEEAHSHSHSPDERSATDDILRKRRKVREPKACYPCRSRKVKCDNNVPCRTCVERKHPELCTLYAQPLNAAYSSQDKLGFNGAHGLDMLSHVATAPSTNGHTKYGDASHVTLSREEWDRICSRLITMEESMSALKEDMARMAGGGPPPSTHDGGAEKSASKRSQADGIHAVNDLTGNSVHLGGSSVPAFVMALGAAGDNTQDVLGKSILPVFGLENSSATYPFIDLWSSRDSGVSLAMELCKMLPGDEECFRFFRLFRDISYTFYPAVVDIDAMEIGLREVIETRRSQPTWQEKPSEPETMYGKDLAWTALLFGILASGCQNSDMPRAERELTSTVYACCAFHCLRILNFFSQPSMPIIQTLLILGYVTTNNMNAGVSWVLMGITLRLSQALGLHKTASGVSESEQQARRRLWWMIVWQDGLLSLSYDRESSIGFIGRDVPLPSTPTPHSLEYADCMYRLCKVTLDIVRSRMLYHEHGMAVSQINGYVHELEAIYNDAADRVRDPNQAQTPQESQQHYGLRLHVSFVISELCRPALRSESKDDKTLEPLRTKCIDNLISTVRAFLGLHQLSPVASRPWSGVHRAVSAALILGIIGEPKRNPDVHALLDEMLDVIAELTTLDGYAMDFNGDPSAQGPLGRAQTALRKLNHVNPTRRPSDSSSSGAGFTPLGLFGTDSSPFAIMDSIIGGSAGMYNMNG